MENTHLLERFKKIKTFIFDVDGVMTDGNILVTEKEGFIRTMHTRDGYALQKAVKKGYQVIIISGGYHLGVKKRFELLGLQKIFIGRDDKDVVFRELVDKGEVDPSTTLYMGDDMPDLKVMRLVDFPTCPQDAAQDVLEFSHYVSPYPGGKGCVRDVLEKVLKLNGDWYAQPAE
jgi:3-deoxy-D-manno-octulosonate 8-phosphate phosphatase (KDO 8-P phosphatase)